MSAGDVIGGIAIPIRITGQNEAKTQLATLGRVTREAANEARESGTQYKKLGLVMQQASYGAQDFIQVLSQPGMGWQAALRATANNAAQVFSFMGPMTGAIAGLGITVAALVPSFFMAGKAANQFKDTLDELKRKAAEFKEDLHFKISFMKQGAEDEKFLGKWKINAGEVKERIESKEEKMKEINTQGIAEKELLGKQVKEYLANTLGGIKTGGMFSGANRPSELEALGKQLYHRDNPHENRFTTHFPEEYRNYALEHGTLADIKNLQGRLPSGAATPGDVKTTAMAFGLDADRTEKGLARLRLEFGQSAEGAEKLKKKLSELNAQQWDTWINEAKAAGIKLFRNLAKLGEKLTEDEIKQQEDALKDLDPYEYKKYQINRDANDQLARLGKNDPLRNVIEYNRKNLLDQAALDKKKADDTKIGKTSGVFDASEFAKHLQAGILKDDTQYKIQVNTAQTAVFVQQTVTKLEELKTRLPAKAVFAP